MSIPVSASYPFRSAAVRVLMVSGFLACAALLWGGGARDYPVVPVSFVDVALTDGFWAPRQETNRLVTIPFMFETYARLGQTPWSPFLEGAASTLAGHPDPALRKRIAAALAEIAEGLIKQTPELKWKHLLNGDLISAGHFFEAAVAFWQATGDRTFLDAASRIADDIDSVFGPGRRRDVSNHEEVKVGLVRLFRATGNSRPLDLARFFLDERGRAGGRDLFGEYAQDHKPVVDQREAVGHGVRAAYLYMALTDIAALTGEPKYAAADGAIWADALSAKSYLTGGIGSHRDLEDFGAPYDLPNVGAWNEFCAANGFLMWNHRMFLLHRDGKYLDVLERVLYNGFLAGIGLSGDRFFYQNPLRSFGGFSRQPWFGPNCCPPNVVRALATLGQYFYAVSGDSIYVNLFASGTAEVRTAKSRVLFRQETGYPWDGRIRIHVDPERRQRFAVLVRIPGWARNEAWPTDLYRYADSLPGRPEVELNGRRVEPDVEKGFLRLEKEWAPGDLISLTLPMPVRRVLAQPRVIDNRGTVALMRGPLVYALESRDNGGHAGDILVPDDAELRAEFRKDLLGGVSVVTGRVRCFGRAPDKKTVVAGGHVLQAIPYYAWANRGEGEMSVWLAREPSRVVLPPAPSIASSSRASSSCGDGSADANYPGGRAPDIATRFYPRAQSGASGFSALSDQVEPTSSADGSGTFFRLRPQAGDSAWVQYDFASQGRVSSVDVYWKDDGELTVLPKSWRVLHRKDGRWLPVVNRGPYPVERDRYSSVAFDPVETDVLRLEIILDGRTYKKPSLGPPDGNYLDKDVVWYECGIIEWRVK